MLEQLEKMRRFHTPTYFYADVMLFSERRGWRWGEHRGDSSVPSSTSMNADKAAVMSTNEMTINYAVSSGALRRKLTAASCCLCSFSHNPQITATGEEPSSTSKSTDSPPEPRHNWPTTRAASHHSGVLWNIKMSLWQKHRAFTLLSAPQQAQPCLRDHVSALDLELLRQHV